MASKFCRAGREIDLGKILSIQAMTNSVVPIHKLTELPHIVAYKPPDNEADKSSRSKKL